MAFQICLLHSLLSHFFLYFFPVLHVQPFGNIYKSHIQHIDRSKSKYRIFHFTYGMNPESIRAFHH